MVVLGNPLVEGQIKFGLGAEVNRGFQNVLEKA